MSICVCVIVCVFICNICLHLGCGRDVSSSCKVVESHVQPIDKMSELILNTARGVVKLKKPVLVSQGISHLYNHYGLDLLFAHIM